MRAAALLLALLLSGCIFGECGYSPREVVWDDPLLWDAIEAPVEAPGGEPVGGGLWLTFVRIPLDHRGPIDKALHWGGGTVVATVADGARDQAREVATRFFANATGGDVAANVSAFLATETREDVGPSLNGDPDEHLWILRYQMRVEIDAVRLIDRLGVTPALHVPEADGFDLGFDTATKTIDISGIQLSVDGFGHAEARHRWREGTTDEAALADLEAALQDAGLPPPTDPEVGGIIC